MGGQTKLERQMKLGAQGVNGGAVSGEQHQQQRNRFNVLVGQPEDDKLEIVKREIVKLECDQQEYDERECEKLHTLARHTLA